MTATTIRVQMAQRKDTAANWTAANPILLLGEIGYETDTKKFKIGDGTTNWNSLAYLPIPDGSGNLTITGNLEIGSTGTLTFEGSTADGFETTLAVTDPTADRTITLPDVTGTVITSGDTGSVTSTMLADGTIVNADINASAEIAVSKLANGTANQVLVTDGTDVSWSDNLTLAGDLTVNGTTTTINTQDLLVEDKNIIIGNVNTPTDVTADGGGITLKGSTDKTINWVDATDAWTLSENVNIASGKEYRINGTKVLDATSLGSAIVSSSLTSVGTIGTGVWQGTAIDAAYLDSTIVTTGDTGTITSTMIADGTIVDGDVNASAAIAGTKISPDFGSQNVTTTGTATAAALIPSGSSVPTNGVYLPSSNNVAISTNGTGRLYINSSGDVGVGVASPAATFGGGGGAVDANGPIISRGALNAELNSCGVLQYNSNVTTLRAYGSSAFSGVLAFATGGGGNPAGTGTTEYMRLTADGKLGLGTSSPSGPIHVTASSNGYISHTFSNTSNGSSAVNRIQIGNDASDGTGQIVVYGSQHSTLPNILDINNAANAAMRFLTNNTERVRITSGGLVGIGTTSVSFGKLCVSKGGAEGIEFEPGDSSNVNVIQHYNRSGAAWVSCLNNAAAHIFTINGGGNEAARIDSSRRLLVGTSTALTTGVNNNGSSNIGAEQQLQVASASWDKASASFTTYQGNVPGVFAQIGFNRSKSDALGTIGSALASGDVLGGITFSGSDGGKFVPGAWITATADGTFSNDDAPGRLVFSTTADGASTPTQAMLLSQDKRFYLSSTWYSNITTANAANVHAISNGEFYRSTSSLKYKTDVETLQDSYADAILNVRPVWYRSTCAGDNPDWGWWGFIAEEVAAIDPRLVQWKTKEVVYDDNGSPVETPCDPEPEGIAYDRFVPHLLNLIKRQKEQIEAMEARLSALEAS